MAGASRWTLEKTQRDDSKREQSTINWKPYRTASSRKKGRKRELLTERRKLQADAAARHNIHRQTEMEMADDWKVKPKAQVTRRREE